MTLNSSGPISLAGTTAGQSIAVELGLGTTTQISLNDSAVRTLAGVPSGAIVMPTNFYGKSNTVAISYTFTTSTANASLNVSTISGYSAGKSVITVTNNSGVYLWANSISTYGLTLTGGTTGDSITLVNNGYIMGQGGTGVAGHNGGVSAGGAGGPALNVAGIGISSIIVNNTNASAYIGGGGGSGANWASGGGGGAGGGTGQTSRSGSGTGAGGAIGAVGSNGPDCCCSSGGGGGGRIFPGTGGSAGRCSGGGGGGGAGGGGGCCSAGAGGASNNAGGSFANHSAGGGGGWGAAGGAGNSCGSSAPGGAGGKAVNLGGKSITWTSGNTTRVWGAVS